MFSGLSGRWAVIIGTLILGVVLISPNFIEYSKESIFGKTKLVEGLDIQGGLQLVMGVDVDSFIQERAMRQSKDVSELLKSDGITNGGVRVGGPNLTNIEITLGEGANKDAILKFVEDKYSTLLQVASADDQVIVLQYFDAAMLDLKRQVVSQAIEVIRNRVDEFGVAEPSITAQGTDRILIQLPGIKDSENAKRLVNQTAKLTFRVVSSEVTGEKLAELIKEAETKGNYQLGNDGLQYGAYVKRLNEDLSSKLPKNSRIVFEKNENVEKMELGKRAYLILTDSVLGGEQLEDASVRPDEYGKPEVEFRFSVEGRRLFAELTGKAAGGLIAIVLDDVVKSAPRVEKQIDSERARITLGGVRDYNAARDEATFIATALRAGSLPAAIQQLEERNVGPSLGSDSIKKARFATLIGSLLVCFFMFFYYRSAGLVADLGLALNLFFTFAILTSLGATVTLPGIAGIALTVGMAVDANVIIFERIKEEMLKGATTSIALKDGFSNAFSSIFDSNLTTILTCMVLIYYGNGPIRGFAVTLTIGILCSMFTAIFVSRTLLETMVHKFDMKILALKN